jgi:RNA polymerase sigma-70 factor (ECF subfamily)
LTLDTATLAELVEVERAGLLRFACRRAADTETAHDVVSEAIATAFEQRAAFRGRTRPEAVAWIYAICRSALSRDRRRRAVEERALARLALEHLEDPEERHGETGEIVIRQLDRLPSHQRDAVRLRVIEELPYEDVARRLGVTSQTARARVSRGLRRLSTRVHPNGR